MSSDEAFVARVLGALREAGLDAVVVGSVAALIQGAPLTTDDMDILVRDTPRNRAKIKDLESRLGGRAVEISPLSSTIRITTAEASLDVLFDEISGGLDFNALRSRAKSLTIGDTVAAVASLEDIIYSKTAAGRPKDLAQLPILQDTLRVLQTLESTNRRTAKS